MPDIAGLLESEIPSLRRYARALTRDLGSADDLVQSCLVRAIAKQHLWQEGTDLHAWLFTILHNQYVNEVRRSVREGMAVPVEDTASALPIKENATDACNCAICTGRWAAFPRDSARRSCWSASKA